MLKLIGLLLALAAFPVLFLNEGRAVRTARGLEEGAAVVVHVESSPVLAANEGRLVHFTGPAATGSMLRDPVFGVEAKALQLSRKVEMYQWKNTGRGQYSERDEPSADERGWSEQAVSASNAANNTHGRRNPDSLPYSTETQSAHDVTVGDYQIPQRLVAGLDGNFTALLLDEAALAALPVPAGLSGGRPKLDRGGLYFGEDPAVPRIGDLRVSFAAKGLGEISVVGGQRGRRVEPYPTGAGGTVAMARMGDLDAGDMFDDAMTANTFLTWMLRGVGFFLMFLGAYMVLHIGGFVRLVPALGGLLNAGMGLVAFVLAGTASVATAALAWIVYRPVVGLTLFGLAAAAGAAAWLGVRRGILRGGARFP